MLELMRNQAQSWIAKVILGGIALSFGLWGVGDYFMGSHVAYVAEVDGKPITDGEFAQTYDRSLNSYRAMLGKQFSKKLAEQLGIKNDTLQTMVNRKLMLDEAAQMGLVASDATLLSYVQSNPAFQEAGVFDPQRYRVLTRNMGFSTTRDYEADARVNLMIDSLQKSIVDSAHVNDAEIRAKFEREFEQRTIAAVMVDSQALIKDIKVDEATAKAWYDAHKQNYQSMLKVKVKAVVIDPKALAKDLIISEATIASAYDERKSSWTVDGVTKPLSEVHDDLMNQLRIEKSRDEAYQLSQDLDNALGMEDSLQAAAQSIGLSVYETAEVNAKTALADPLLGSDQAVLNHAFTSLPDETISIIELADGRFVALETAQRTEPITLSFQDAAASVYDDARIQEAQKKAQAIANDLVAKASSKTPDSIAQDTGYAKFLSKPVRKNGVGDDATWITPSILQAAFQTPAGQWASQPIETSRGLALVYVQDLKQGDNTTFEEQKDAIAFEASKAKGAVRFARWMATVRDRHDIVVHEQVLAQF